MIRSLHTMRERNILSESQYGFRTGHSCADLLTVAIDDWLFAQDSKMHTAIVFIDLSKAFDNVQHQLLLLKLQQHGIGGSALAWLVLELPVSTLPKCYAQWLIIRVLLLIKRCFPGQRPWTVTLQHLCGRTSINLLSNIMHHCHHLPMKCHYIVHEKLKKKRAETPVKPRPWALSRSHCRRLD